MSTATDWWRCSAEEYHAHGAISRSEFVDFVRNGPVYYRQKYIDKTLIEKPSEQMQLGTDLHALVLEGKLPTDTAVIIPRDVLNGDGHRKGTPWTDFKKLHEGKVLVTQAEANEQNRKLMAMRESIMACRPARRILDRAEHREVGALWSDAVTGLRLRCRFDLICEGGIADIKTTSGGITDREWSNTVATWRYDIQELWYSRGFFAATQEFPDSFDFIVVQSAPPFECRVFRLGEKFRECAATKIDAKLPELAERLANEFDGAWDRKNAHEITEVDPPRWLETDDQWED